MIDGMSGDTPPSGVERPTPEDAGRSGERLGEEQWQVPPAHLVLWGAVAGLLLGVAVLFADYSSWDVSDRDRAREGPFILWTVAIAAQTMAWVFAIPLIHSVTHRWRSRAGARQTEMRAATAALVLFGAAIAVGPLFSGQELPATVPHRSLKLGLLNIAGFAIAIYAARAMWYAAYELRRLGSGSAANLAALEKHRRLRADLEHLLGVLGALVSLGVIASAGLHALTVHVQPAKALPVQSVIAYGIVLSVVLALTYVPVHLTMLEAGGKLRDRIAPMLEVGKPDFGDRLDDRARLDHFLGLDVPPSVRFRGAVVILGPLLGSLTSLIPELGG
jgi:hypothetical protein